MGLKTENVRKAAPKIARAVEDFHYDHKPGAWNATAGQWLVYGFEGSLGFAGAVGLEADVERAFRKGARGPALIEAVEKSLMEFVG